MLGVTTVPLLPRDLDATPPASPGRGKGHSGSRSGSESNPLPFTVIDTRSPSPKGKSSEVNNTVEPQNVDT